MLPGANVLRGGPVPRWVLLGAYALRTDEVPPQAPRETVKFATHQLGSGLFGKVIRASVFRPSLLGAMLFSDHLLVLAILPWHPCPLHCATLLLPLLSLSL